MCSAVCTILKDLKLINEHCASFFIFNNLLQLRISCVTAKTGRTSCTNWTISFEVSGFLTRTHLLHGHFIFLNLLQLQTFLRTVHTIQSDVMNFQNFLTSFAIFQSFTDLFRELNDREIENHYKMNSENVETWHGIIISPT